MLQLLRRSSSSIAHNGSRNPLSLCDEVLRATKLHLDRQQIPAALLAFKKQLRSANQASLERCVQLFGLHGKGDGATMLKAFKMLLETGYTPSVNLWTRLLQVAPIEANELQELAKVYKMPSISDEKAVVALMTFHAKARRPEVVEEIFDRYKQALQDEGQSSHPGPYVWKALIDARGMVSDLEGARHWFHVWRTSRAHPYGNIEEEPSAAARKPDPVPIILGEPHRTGSSLPLFRSKQVGVSHLLQGPRGAHTLSEVPGPSSLPYIALLNHLSEQTKKGNKSSLRLIDLMAADRVPLDKNVINALMQYELHRDEASVTESVLALYEIMRGRSGTSMQPDEVTFKKVFKAYKEPKRRMAGFAFNIALPTMLARNAGLKPPSEDYAQNPRRVFLDLLTQHPGSPLCAKLLDGALSAFINRRDFVGACVVLQMYKVFRTEPSSRTHAIVVHGVLRARWREEAFCNPAAQAWLTPECSEKLLERVSQLNELAGYKPYTSSEVIRIQSVPAARGHASSPVNAYLISRPPPSSLPELWNGRAKPRTPSELHATRRFEFRDTSYLFELLRRASPYGIHGRAWLGELEPAVVDMCPPPLRRRVYTASMAQPLPESQSDELSLF